MYRFPVRHRTLILSGASLVALTASAIAGMNLNNVSKGMPEVEKTPSLTKAAIRFPRIEAIPHQGFNIEFGTKYAVGYYQQVDEKCQVVLTYAEPMNWDAHPIHVTTRLETTLESQQWTSYMSNEGASLQFNCGSGARTLTVKALPRQFGG